MLGLARFAMKSPLHTGILAALFAAIPMLYALSAALVALTTLRYGTTQGTRILAAAMVGAMISWQMSGIPLPLLALPFVTILALVLRSTQRWSVTLLAGSVTAFLLANGLQIMFSEQISSIMDIVQDALTGGDTSLPLWQLIESSKSIAGYLILTSMLLESYLMLLLGRYWQAGLYNPGGFRAELHNLRFSRQEVAVLVGVIAISWFTEPAAVMLFGIPLIFAGIALVHGVIAKTKLGGQWLVAMYIGLVLFNQIIVPVLVCAAIIDAMVDLRSRLPNDAQANNE
ncbi:hypothetical protein QWZ13_07805 [Reinekea marina]|uniref:Membrane protein DUF2232 n=1 Tax=Reinekea marina TaxID=1310421 RepID=A0ABV7WVD1_9GAMM|nr:hypothetical protein [Reinekea marina]MDN3648812.1 hypothetical protein [Reinekea marina]